MRRAREERQPLCGSGVISLMLVTVKPFAFSARTAESRPDPTPLTKTASSRKPVSFTLSAIVFTIMLAAYGVAFFGPRNPQAPAEDQARVFPFWSVTVTIVL